MTETHDTATQKVSPRDAQKGGQGALSKEHPEVPLREDAPQADSFPPRREQTSNGLTSAQIALLCEIGERDLADLSGDAKRDLERLRSEAYIAPAQDSPNAPFKLTAKGVDFLGRRGAGLNEA
jgi:hypothetical protein